MAVGDFAHLAMVVQNEEIALAFFFLRGGESASSHLIGSHDRLNGIGVVFFVFVFEVIKVKLERLVIKEHASEVIAGFRVRLVNVLKELLAPFSLDVSVGGAFG